MLPSLSRSLFLCSLAGLCACGPVAPDANEPTGSGDEWTEESTEVDPDDGFEEMEPGEEAGAETAAPVAGAPSAGLNAAQQAVLARHNQHRADHCAPPLQWSPKLAAVAQQWADQLKQNGCAFEHSQNSPYGENLSFFAPVGSSSPEEVVTGWYSEVSEYDYANPAFGMNTGHFTQVVWRGTTGVGCGQSQCNGGELWVCNYNPPGNMSGSFVTNVQPKGCAGQ